MGGGLRSEDTVNSQLGDGVSQSVVGDIDQELKVVQEVSPEVEGVGLRSECRDAGIVDCLKRDNL